MVQPSDYRVAVITGSSAGVTGGDLINEGQIGVIHDISYAEVAGTGAKVTVTSQPSGVNIDVKTLAANGSFAYGEAREAVLGIIPRLNVLQVTTNVGSVVARVVYHVEAGAS